MTPAQYSYAIKLVAGGCVAVPESLAANFLQWCGKLLALKQHCRQ